MKADDKKEGIISEIERFSGHKDLLAKSEISLWLDTYDDVFSDFDPRPFSQRALSHDFLEEAKRATRELEPGVLELRFLMPGYERDLSEENVIRRRLHEHFKKHAMKLEKEMKWIIKKAAFFVMLGFLLLLIAAFLSKSASSTFIFYFMIVVFEPSGWFMLWYGMDQIFYSSKDINPDLTFYERMSRAEITFEAY